MESFLQSKTIKREVSAQERGVAGQFNIDLSPEHIQTVKESIASVTESRELEASISKVNSNFTKLSRSIIAALALSAGVSAAHAESPETNPQLLDIATEKMQFNIQNFAQRNGFKIADVKFTEKEGEWVIHVGQTHFINTYENTSPAARLEVMKAQTKIENALVDLKEKKNISDVYVEAFTEKSETYKKELAEVCHIFDKDFPNTKEGRNDAKVLKDYIVSYYGTDDRMSAYTEYSYFKKFMYGTSEYNASEQKVLFYGAVDKLFCDRIIKPRESERSATNTKGVVAIKKYNQVADQTDKDIEVLLKNLKKLDPMEAQQIRSQALENGYSERELYQQSFALDAVIESIPMPVEAKNKLHSFGQAAQDYAFFTLTNREYVALERIAEQSKKHQPQNPHILVFGSAHQFNTSLNMWNEKHPKRKMNYIRLEIVENNK